MFEHRDVMDVFFVKPSSRLLLQDVTSHTAIHKHPPNSFFF